MLHVTLDPVTHRMLVLDDEGKPHAEYYQIKANLETQLLQDMYLRGTRPAHKKEK